MIALDVLLEFHDALGGLWSTEKPGTRASKSELRRWFDNKAVVINGVAVGWRDHLEFWESLVLFPNGKRKTTLL